MQKVAQGVVEKDHGCCVQKDPPPRPQPPQVPVALAPLEVDQARAEAASWQLCQSPGQMELEAAGS